MNNKNNKNPRFFLFFTFRETLSSAATTPHNAHSRKGKKKQQQGAKQSEAKRAEQRILHVSDSRAYRMVCCGVFVFIPYWLRVSRAAFAYIYSRPWDSFPTRPCKGDGGLPMTV